jgi:hypothetical protein
VHFTYRHRGYLIGIFTSIYVLAFIVVMISTFLAVGFSAIYSDNVQKSWREPKIKANNEVNKSVGLILFGKGRFAHNFMEGLAPTSLIITGYV